MKNFDPNEFFLVLPATCTHLKLFEMVHFIHLSVNWKPCDARLVASMKTQSND